MAEFDFLSPKILQQAVFDQRFTAAARTGVDLGVLETWDRSLPRHSRILVPIDVQAYVMPVDGDEMTVPVCSFGDDEPLPFDEGEVKAPGVHLHWAMPDSLLRGRDNPITKRLEFPALPDRWVVVRSLLPRGGSRALVSGWAIDAASGANTPLTGFAGTFPDDPEGKPLMVPLDAAYGGSLLWTSSYEASQGRFAMHDPLTDLAGLEELAPRGFERGQAVYTVCGWWGNPTQDPLSGIGGTAGLERRMADLGWLAHHDGDDDELNYSPDPKLARLRSHIGFATDDRDADVEVMVDGATRALTHDGVLPEVMTPVANASKVIIGRRVPTFSSLLHGAVLGVPIDGKFVAADDRPSPEAIEVAIGLDVDDVVAALGANALGLSGSRQGAERLVAAFAGNLLDRFTSPDGLSELEEREHAEGFWSFPGPPVPGSQPDRLRAQDSASVHPGSVGRKGRGQQARIDPGLVANVAWQQKIGGLQTIGGAMKSVGGAASPAKYASSGTSRRVSEAPKGRTAQPPSSREVVRPAPRLFRPQAPMVALRGAKPSHRHHDDGLYDESGRLRCRYPRECVTAIEGVVDGAAILPTLGNGAVPTEVLTVAREALLLNPYAGTWLAAAGAPQSLFNQARTRLTAEFARLYGNDATYDPSGRATISPAAFGIGRADDGPQAANEAWQPVSQATRIMTAQVAAELARFSLYNGTPPSPIAITTWRQPWVPMWLEWKVTLTGSDRLDGWDLGDIDLAASTAVPPTAPLTFEFTGRSTINEGVADALAYGIKEWVDAEQARAAARPPVAQISTSDAATLENLADTIAPVDLVSASLDGVREQLLGIPYLGQFRRVTVDGVSRPEAAELPVALFGGKLRLDTLRLVDTFGRTLDIPLNAARTTTTLEVAGEPTSIQLRPRVQNASRWLFRLVDPAYSTAADPLTAPEAYVDQTDPALGVNPIVGYLLPDHIDEALECFTVDGSPLGQLMHDEITGGVTWEPAPDRPLPPDAGPLADLDDHTRLLGRMINGVVQTDVTARSGDDPPSSSSLATMLRAIDTTLWTVDTYGALGTPSVAGLVGRPIAVVRATLRLEIPDDLAEVNVTEAGGPDARRAAFAALDDQRFPVRLGDLHRSDDSLLGFFVDDDYTKFHVVDRAVVGAALESGRHRGFLGLLGDEPEPDSLDHPFVVEEDTLFVRPGQVVRLTLLMLPAGRVHLTSGILPRKALALAEDWVTPGLVRLNPSVRVGPVLVDPSEIRLPLIQLLGDRQTFTRRTGPLTWKEDPILAASQSALLPRLPHEAQEGWVRVTPEDPTGVA
jgi:hypothetical protein